MLTKNVFVPDLHSSFTKADNAQVSRGEEYNPDKCDNDRDQASFIPADVPSYPCTMRWKRQKPLFSHVIMYRKWILIANDQALNFLNVKKTASFV